MEINVRNWYGYNICFVKHEGTWYAVLTDICDALHLPIYTTLQYVSENNIRELSLPSSQSTQVINERGVYQVILSKNLPNAEPLIVDWACDLYEQLRIEKRMQPYNVMFMTEPEIQRCINKRLRYIFGTLQTVKNKE